MFSDLEKSDILNRAFASTFTTEDCSSMPSELAPISKNMEHEIITESMVEEAIDNLNVNKAAGPDDIYARIIKELKEQLVPIMTQIFNKSLMEEVVPPE